MNMFFKKGVTIIELVIVIIILILIAMIALFNTNKPWVQSQAMAYNEEFKSLYSALTMVQAQHNVGQIDLVDGSYFYSSFTESGETWYTLYGQNSLGGNVETEFYNTNTDIIERLGLNDLKLSYEYKLYDADGSNDIEIRLLNNDYIAIKGYKIRTYSELKELINSGAI